MNTFHWTKDFVTGVAEVDEQHHELLNLANKLGNAILQGGMAPEEMSDIIQSIVDYTHYHFEEEEKLMHRERLSLKHIERHVAQHKRLADDIKEFSQVVTLNESFLTHLYHYMTHWLVYHILGEDKNMARQLAAIQSGMDAETAYEKEEIHADDIVAPLLNSLKSMFEEMSTRNKELILLTQTLEEQVKQRTLQLERLSYTDPLTDLANRRYIMEELKRLWLEESNLLVMFIDIDNFKMVNDSFGHDVGDKLLIELAKILKYTFYTTDVVARLGGDEFMVMCSKLSMAQAYELGEKALSEISQIAYQVGELLWKGAVSIGIAERRPNIGSVSELLKVADQGVYMAKEEGKNCIRSIQMD